VPPDLVFSVLRLRPSPPIAVAIAAIALAAVLVLAAVGRAPAQPAIGGPVNGGDSPVVHDERIDDALAAVPVLGPAVAEAHARYRRDEQAHRVATDDEGRAQRELAALAEARSRLDATVNRATRRRDKSTAELAVLRRAIAGLAVEQYVLGNSASSVELELSAGSATRARARRAVGRTVQRRQLDDARAHSAAIEVATAELDTIRTELDDVDTRQHEWTAARDEAAGRRTRLAGDLMSDARTLADARLLADVRGADFVLVALASYHRAARTMATEQPGCRLPWTLLAGIGRTESGHGTFRGARLDVNGTVSRPIIGIPLDGTNGTARIPDTDGGAFDGDAALDRAVGPMQFIPSTWARWGRDGNGDGRTDPQNLFDAALAAAGYLCLSGPGLDDEARLRGAVYRYNNDGSYVDTVLRHANGYAALGLV
jgi:membrane-bound lytic murein transglycosylase B